MWNSGYMMCQTPCDLNCKINTLTNAKMHAAKWSEGKGAIPFVNWKACRAHRSAASLTGVFPSFKHSATTGPNMEAWIVIAEGFACHRY